MKTLFQPMNSEDAGKDSPNKLIADIHKAAPQNGISQEKVPTNESSADSKIVWTPRQTIAMSSAALGYSLIVLLLATAIAKSLKSAEHSIRLFTVVLIINSALFFIVAGYSSQQIAPAFGLLGTMAGYVLGKSQETAKDQDSEK